MKNFGHIGFTDEQIDMLGAAERFCRENSPMEKVRALMNSDLGYDAEIWDEIGALGWLGIAIPEEYGGVGLSLTEVSGGRANGAAYDAFAFCLNHFGGSGHFSRWL